MYNYLKSTLKNPIKEGVSIVDTLKTRMLDELGRLNLPKEARTQLNWGTGDTLYAVPSLDGKTVILAKAQETSGPTDTVIDSIGRITLHSSVRKAMCWNTRDAICASANKENGTMSLVLIKKHKAGCVLCKRPEEIVIINGSGICKSCVEIAAQALPQAQ